MSNVSFSERPIVHMGVGLVLATVVQSAGLQNFAASKLAFMASGCFAGLVDNAYKEETDKLDYRVCSWLDTTFNGGKLTKKDKTEVRLATLGASFFMNLVLFLGTGSYRSLANVMIMTGLNYVAGQAAYNALKNNDII